MLDESSGRARWRVRRRLPAGRYRLTSFERPCSGNCSLLDPPTDRCSRRITIIAHGRTGVRATVRPGRGCRMRVRARAGALPSARARAGRPPLPRPPGRDRGLGADRFARPHAWHRRPGAPSSRRAWSRRCCSSPTCAKPATVRLTSGERALLGPMITRSDNELATAVFARVGDAGLRDVAARAGMRRFSVSGYWSGAHFSAADQARFFRVFDRLMPPRSRGYARTLLSSIVAWQRWGFSRFSLAAGFDTFFKGGWRSHGLGRLVHEAALFERGPLRVSMALLSDGNPSHDYGTATLRGVGERIFAMPAGGSRPRAPVAPGRAAAAANGAPDAALRRAGLETSSAPPGHSRRARLRDPGQPHRPAPAGLLREPSPPAPPRRPLARARAAPPAPPRARPARARRLPAGARLTGTRALGRAQRPRRPRRHLHRPSQPPQHRHRRRPDARAGGQRPPAPDGDGLRRPLVTRAHEERAAAARCATACSSRARWSASASTPTGASGGTSSTARREPLPG